MNITTELRILDNYCGILTLFSVRINNFVIGVGWAKRMKKVILKFNDKIKVFQL